MRKLLMALGIAGMVMGMPLAASAHDAYDDSESHPLRLVAYAVHPVGYALEWAVMRPIHFVVSNPGLERMFGHTPHESPFGDYRPYNPDDVH